MWGLVANGGCHPLKKALIRLLPAARCPLLMMILGFASSSD
jgi:hypothetical protein